MGMITVKKGDITKEDAEVIVNAANTRLKGGGGVDGAIHRAAGSAVMKECRRIGHCATGDVVMTTAGKLRAKKLFHTAGPVWRGGNHGEPALLRSCYEKAFRQAAAQGFRTIAFPAISTGVYRYPRREAAYIALSAGRAFQDRFDDIRYVCFSDDDCMIYESVWEELKTGSTTT